MAASVPAGDYLGLLARLEGLRTLGVDLGLERVRLALRRLGSPEARVPAVQIAGTNGKGSTAAMTDAILREAGVRTGLFTSPHLCRFTERIRVAGHEADGDRLARLADAVAATGVRLTYFEVATLLAILVMAEDGVEMAVMETGLGGRLDATTACRAVATAITSISFDHTELLGSELAQIAREKAGIARRGVPMLVGPLAPEADAVVAAVAAEAGAPVLRVGAELPVPDGLVALAGRHQRSNAALAAALAEAACRSLGRPLEPDAVARGIALTRWPGRLEWLDELTLLDCAHNPEGAATLAASLPPRTPGAPRALVISVVRGKDAVAMLAALAPCFDVVVATASRNERAVPAAELARAWPGMLAVPLPMDAVSEARRRVGGAGRPGLVVVAGSTFLVGEVRATVLREPADPIQIWDPMPCPGKV